MTRHRKRPPDRSTQRPDRLLVADRRRTGYVERIPPQLPAICPSCLGVVGLAEVGEDRFCRSCGEWATVDEALAGIAEVAN